MKFALGTPGLILYPPIMSPWEPAATGADIVKVAQAADELGWDYLTASEHIVMPTEMAGVMGPRFPDSLAATAVLAGATKSIHLLTYVLVLPYRNPVLLAKEVATVDFLSEGRFALGVGGGHMQREFEALGVPFDERGTRTDEYLLAMKELWSADAPSFVGRYARFDNIVFEPKPVQKPHPPVFIGGNSKPAMRRAAKFGDGWLPWLVTREQLPGCLDYIRAQPDSRACTEGFEVVMPLTTLNVEDYTHRPLGPAQMPTNRDEIIDEIGMLWEAGVTVTQVVAPRTASVDQSIEWIQWFAGEIMPAFEV